MRSVGMTGLGISVMPRHGSSHIEAMLKRLLDQHLQRNPRLVGNKHAVLFLEWPLVYTSGEEERNCVID